MTITAPPSPQTESVVVVLHMKGCGHCKEYLPRVARMASKYPYVTAIAIGDDDARFEPLAEKYGAQYMPTTLVLHKPAGAKKWESAVDNGTLEGIFQLAAGGSRG